MNTDSLVKPVALPTEIDWHAPGVYAIRNPDGAILFDTFADTAYSARSTFLREHNFLWSKAITKGFVMLKFDAVAEVVDERYPRP